MSLPQARITNPTPRERLSIGAWSAKSGIERLKISSAWVAFLTSSAGVVIAPAILFWLVREICGSLAAREGHPLRDRGRFQCI